MLVFITITMMLANLFNMYGVISYLDKIEHLLSGVNLFFVGPFILIKMAKRKGLGDLPSNIIIWFAFLFAVAMAGMWEIYEFTVDHLFRLNSQNGSLSDTMMDMICGTLSAAVAAFYLYSKAIDFYKLCFEVFGNTDYTIVMSIGNKVQIYDLGDIPQNFIVKNYVPQTDVLQYTKLFITHGGMNSAHEGLYYGVPLIVIPQSADQPIIAEQVANIGAGIKLQMQGLTATELREAIGRVLTSPSFKKAVATIRDSFRTSGGSHQAVDEIFKWKRQYLG